MMSEASRFLTSVAQAVSTMGLYKAGHPARERALDAAHDRLRELQQVTPLHSYSTASAASAAKCAGKNARNAALVSASNCVSSSQSRPMVALRQRMPPSTMRPALQFIRLRG